MAAAALAAAVAVFITGGILPCRPAAAFLAGKYVLGYKQTLKALRGSKAKLVLIAGNCSVLRKSEVRRPCQALHGRTHS